MKKYFKALFFCALLPLAFSACSDLVASGGNLQNAVQGQASGDGKAVITFDIGNGIAKSAFPAFKTEDLSSIIIYHYQGESSEGELVGSWDSYAQMQKASFEFKTGSRYFEIYAAIQDSCFYDKKLVNITSGTNSVSFSPVFISFEDWQTLQGGSGSVKINLRYPTANVNLVTGGLYKLDGSPVPGFNDQELTQKDGGNVSYEKTGVPSGTYLVTFNFYADAEKTRLLGTYREYAYIAASLTSVSDCEAAALGGLFAITLNFNDGQLKAGQAAPANYTRRTQDISLPEAVRSGYVFDGWYETSDFSGGRVYGIPSGSAGDKVFYAKWTSSPKVTVTFNANGGSVTTGSQEMPKDALTALKSASELGLSAPTGKIFLGWAESDGAAQAKYSDGQLVKLSEDTTLYALWSAIDDADKTKDTDKDGLTDYDELTKYFTDPTSPDTDGDGWKDGEEVRMYSAENLSFSPLIADTPNLEVTFDGKPTIYYKYTTTEGKTETESRSENNGTTGSESSTRTNTITHSLVNGWSAQIAFGHKWGVIGANATAESNWQATFGYNGNVSVGDTYTFSEAASQGWSKSWSNGKSTAETSGKTMTGGLILINAKFKNPSNTAYNVKNVNVSIKRIPNNIFSAAIPMASIPVKELGVIAPGGESAYVIQQDLTLPQTEELLKWSSGLSIEVAGYTISTFQNGVLQPNDFTEALTRVKAQTAEVNIDFGVGNGIPPQKFNVSVKNKYNKNSTGMNDMYTKPTLKEVFEKILNYKAGADFVVDDLGYLKALKSISNAASGKDGVWFVSHLKTESGIKKKTLYFPFTESMPADKRWNFGNIVLNPGDVVNIFYSVDKDEDGLPLNEELIYGTDDTKKDTDGDGINDFDEVFGWYKSGIGLAAKYSDSNKVKTSPVNTDTDGDDLLDYSTDLSKQDADPLVPKDSDDTRLGSVRYATTLGGNFTDFSFDASGNATLDGDLYEYIYLDVTPKIAFAKIQAKQEDGDYADLNKNKVIKLALGTNKIVVKCVAPSGKSQEYKLTVNSRLREMKNFKAASELTGGGVTNFTWNSYADDRMKLSTGGYVLYGVKGRTQSILGDDKLEETKAATEDTPEKDFKNVSEFWAKLTPEMLSKGLLSVKSLATGTQYGFYIFAYTTDAKGDFVSTCLGKRFIKTGNAEEGLLSFRARYIRDIEDHDGGHQESEYYWTFEDTSGMNFGKFSVDRANWFNADYVAAPYYSWADSKEHKEEPSDTSKMITISHKFSRLKDQSFTVHWHGREADKSASLDDYLGTVTAVFTYSSAMDTWTCKWSCAGAESKTGGGQYVISSKEKELKNKWQIINKSSGEIEFVWDWSWDLDLNAQ